MRGRDLALISTLVLVIAAAAIDVLRNGDEEPTATETRAQPPPPASEPEPQREAPDDYPRGLLRGSLVFANRLHCRIRVFDLAGGRERILPPLTACTFWVSPKSLSLAYRSEGRAFFRDLAASPWGDLGSFSNLAGPITWSPDGTRAALCVRGGGGFDFDVVEHELPPERLNRCPAAYAPSGQPAFVLGGQVIVDGRPIVETMGQILFVSGAADGSIAVIVATQPFPPNRLERWEDGRLVDAVEIPGRLGRWPPVFSPDNCAALFRDIDQGWFEVIALDCLEAERPDFLIFGDSRAVAWSPDGRWIAVAYSDRIGFHRVADGEEVASWPAQAAAIAWTND